MTEEIIRLAEVAKRLGVSKITVRRRINDDPEFPRPFRLSQDGPFMWRAAEVDAYLERKAERKVGR
jgi:predicted DNA-binding transcriptional regulator AlpA